MNKMLEFKAKGTIQDLEQLFHWDQLYLMIGVGYYNRSMVPEDEIFTISENELANVGIIKKQKLENYK